MKGPLAIFIFVALLVLVVGLFYKTSKQPSAGDQVLPTATPETRGTTTAQVDTTTSINTVAGRDARDSGPLNEHAGPVRSAWKPYQSKKFGFSISYPPQYALEIGSAEMTTGWVSADLLSIYNPADTSTREFRAIPVHVVISKQPLVSGGLVYHSIDDYVRGERENIGSKYEIVSLREAKAVHIPRGQGDAEDASMEEYVFIKNDFIYQIYLNENDPYRAKIVQSIDL